MFRLLSGATKGWPFAIRNNQMKMFLPILSHLILLSQNKSCFGLLFHTHYIMWLKLSVTCIVTDKQMTNLLVIAQYDTMIKLQALLHNNYVMCLSLHFTGSLHQSSFINKGKNFVKNIFYVSAKEAIGLLKILTIEVFSIENLILM